MVGRREPPLPSASPDDIDAAANSLSNGEIMDLHQRMNDPRIRRALSTAPSGGSRRPRRLGEGEESDEFRNQVAQAERTIARNAAAAIDADLRRAVTAHMTAGLGYAQSQQQARRDARVGAEIVRMLDQRLPRSVVSAIAKDARLRPSGYTHPGRTATARARRPARNETIGLHAMGLQRKVARRKKPRSGRPCRKPAPKRRRRK